jgi:hypothetical protein
VLEGERARDGAAIIETQQLCRCHHKNGKSCIGNSNRLKASIEKSNVEIKTRYHRREEQLFQYRLNSQQHRQE